MEMALVQLDAGSDPWLTEHELCEKLCREIVQQLTKRDTLPRNSDKFSAASASIRLKLKQFVQEVDQLKFNLLYSNALTLEEKERRQRLVEDLESKSIQLQQQFRISKLQRDRNRLLNEEEGGSSSWLDDSEVNKPLLSDEFVPSVDTLRQEQKKILEEQDRGLENLSKVISRQKGIAVTIGNEVDLHNELLDDISIRMDSTNTSIQRESVEVRVITDKDNTCGYWLVILILFVGIVTLALI